MSDIPCISIPPREYTDLRIEDLRKERSQATKVQDEKWIALEKVSDLRIKALEDQIKGYKQAVWALGFGVLMILADIFIRRGGA